MYMYSKGGGGGSSTVLYSSSVRGGSRNSLRGGGILGQNSSKGGFRVQVRGNFHILTSKKKKKPLKGEGFNPLSLPLVCMYVI